MTRGLDVLQELTLLLKLEGILVENELYMEELAIRSRLMLQNVHDASLLVFRTCLSNLLLLSSSAKIHLTYVALRLLLLSISLSGIEFKSIFFI